MILKNYDEVIGFLVSVSKCSDFLSLLLKLEFELRLPKDAIPLDLLKTFVDKKIGIINIDGTYHIREDLDKNNDVKISDLDHQRTLEEMSKYFKGKI